MHARTHIPHHSRVRKAEMSPSTACLWSLGVCGQSGLRSWLCTCQGQEPVLKKEPRRNQRARPAGALHRQAQPGPGRPPAPSRPSSAGLQDLGHPVRMWVPPCPSPHTSHPPPHSGGVVWRGGGFKSPRVSDRSDRSPNSSQAQVPLRGSERLSGIALPWIRRRFMDFHSAWSLSTRLNRQGSVLRFRNRLQWLLFVLSCWLCSPPHLFFPHSSPPLLPRSGQAQ